MVRITGHVLCLLLLSANGFIPFVHSANLIFFGSLAKSRWLSSKSCHCFPLAAWRNLPSFLCLSEACQLISFASSGLANKLLSRSTTGMYHITRGGIFFAHNSQPLLYLCSWVLNSVGCYFGPSFAFSLL